MYDPLRSIKYSLKVWLAAASFFILLVALALPAELRHGPTSLGWLLLDVAPGALAAGVAFFLASHFVASLYKLDNWRAGAGHIWRCIFGQPSFRPYVHVLEGKEIKATDDVLLKVGGPGSILIYNDSAALLERGGRLTRVLGPGKKVSRLEPFEKVRDVLDLRPMHWEYQVEAMSKEGIRVAVSADIEFQIDTGGRRPTDESPYPALDDAIFRASTGRWMGDPDTDEDQSFDWARRVVISETEKSLRGIIARYKLNELVGLELQPTSEARQPRQDIQRKLREALEEPAARLGVQINKVRLGTIKVDDDVSQQWIDAWRAEWQNWSLVQARAGEAERQQRRETAKAQAQVDMITAVARAFQDSVARDARIPSQLLVMRLIEVFDRTQISPFTYLPGEAMATLDRLRKLVETRADRTLETEEEDE